MARMPKFNGYRLVSESDTLIDMIQSQESKLMFCRRDDHWDVQRRRFASREKHLGTNDLTQAGKDKLKLYFLHLLAKEYKLEEI